MLCGCGAKQTNKDKQGLGAGCGAVRMRWRCGFIQAKAWFGAVLSAMVGCKVKVLGLVRG